MPEFLETPSQPLPAFLCLILTVEANNSLISRHAKTIRDEVDEFQDLVRIYEMRVYLLARSICGSHADAEDLSQNVRLNVWQSLLSFRGDSSFLTSVRHILVNTYSNDLRKKQETQ